jgi:hypothetical protein
VLKLDMSADRGSGEVSGRAVRLQSRVPYVHVWTLDLLGDSGLALGSHGTRAERWRACSLLVGASGFEFPADGEDARASWTGLKNALVAPHTLKLWGRRNSTAMALQRFISSIAYYLSRLAYGSTYREILVQSGSCWVEQ